MPEELHDEDLADWVCVAAAARLLPSPHSGKRTHLSTIYRLINSGKLECRKRGRWKFVRRSAVVALLQPVDPPARNPPMPLASKKVQDWAEAVLKKHRAV